MYVTRGMRPGKPIIHALACLYRRGSSRCFPYKKEMYYVPFLFCWIHVNICYCTLPQFLILLFLDRLKINHMKKLQWHSFILGLSVAMNNITIICPLFIFQSSSKIFCRTPFQYSAAQQSNILLCCTPVFCRPSVKYSPVLHSSVLQANC
jgi:hypothetical protein